ncbi:MAG: aryl-sulfate sulfotransferase [Armatimonadota bacterium]
MNTQRIVALLMLTLLTLPAIGYERLQGPTELLFSDQTKAAGGYTLFGVGGRSFLIDLEGRVVHTWPLGTNPRLLENGNLLDAGRDDPSGFGGFKEVDWDGKTVWEYTEKRPDYFPHHDWVRIFNKQLNAPTTLYIANKNISNEQALAAGANPKYAPYREGQMDAVVEVDMSGKVIWEWCFFDHVVQDLDATKPNYVGQGKTVAAWPGKLNINLPGRPLRKDWLHCNSMDYNAESGHIVINSVQGELYVIDHDGTFVTGDPQASLSKAAGTAGDFRYRFGDPARYSQGDPPRIMENWDTATSGHKQMGGAHDVHWIRPGLPGAGHLMVFNNGQYLYQRTPQSSILEINPFLDANGRDTGKYVNPPDAGYRRETYDHDTHNEPRQISNQVVWSYRSANSHGFFSHIGGSGQRLANGNTLICSDTEGHLFEVTKEGQLVWEYLNPVTREGALTVLPDALPMTNSVFRVLRYAADYPAFKGRDLTSQGTITERAAKGLDARPAGQAGGRAPAGGGGGAKRDQQAPPQPAAGDGTLAQGGGNGPRPGGLHLLPREAEGQLNLTADQQKRLADLEAYLQTKLDTILTPPQQEQLRQLRQTRPKPPTG